MPNAKKIATVENLTQTFNDSQSIVLADYTGISVNDQNQLRSQLQAAGGQLTITKNTLFRIVANQAIGEHPELIQALKGPNAFLFATGDAVAPIKVLFEFAKTNENLKIKLGILDGKVLSYQETEALSKLPSKQELIGQLLARLNGPMYGLVSVIQGPMRGLVYALSAIKDKKATA